MCLCILPNHCIGRRGQTARLTWAELGNRSARSWISRGGRFSSTRSFKNGNPLWNAGEELVDCLKIFLFQIWEIFQDLVLGHARGEIRCQIVHGEAQATN